MHILVDLDSTLADWGKQYDADLNAIGCDTEDVDCSCMIPRTAKQKAFNLHAGMTQHQSKIITKIMDRPGFYADLEPFAGAVEAMQYLLNIGHNVSIVTSPWLTNPTCVQDKYDWVAKYLGIDWVDRVIITKDKTLIDGDVLIDDRPDIVGKVSKPKWKQIIFDQPYNQDSELPRIDSWFDDYEYKINDAVSGNNKTKIIPPLKCRTFPGATTLIGGGSSASTVIDKELLTSYNEITSIPNPSPVNLSGEVRMTSSTGGQKGAKLTQMSALDPHSIKLIGDVAGFGSAKYAKLNFMKGYDWSLSYDAMQRHLMQFWAGQDRDEESGMLHLAHAGWHALAMISFYERGLGNDDRYTSTEDLYKLQTKTLG